VSTRANEDVKENNIIKIIKTIRDFTVASLSVVSF
jgi:hypothetical protein